MNTEKALDLLEEGISAARKGDVDSARELLSRSLEIDQESERAWLWMSSVVEASGDRRICLENVLVINPENEPALRGLVRLGDQAGETNSTERIEILEFTPASPAAALLFPERHRKELRWHDSIVLRTVGTSSIASRSDFKDIWETEKDICPFCAGEIQFDDKRCPNCRHKLTTRAFRYRKSSTELTIYWVLLLGTAELFLFQAILELLVGESLVAVAWHGLLFVMVVLLVVGVSLRQIWAYPASILIMLVIFTSMTIGFISGNSPDEALSSAIGDDLVSFLSLDLEFTLLQSLLSVGQILQYAAVTIALLYGIFKIGPDFERVQSRHVAQVDKGINDASGYYAIGRKYADRRMWATAILHWQRAAANEPGRAYYQRVLGEAYARLGFYQRSIDVLESALSITTDPNSREHLAGLINKIQFEAVDIGEGQNREEILPVMKENGQ